MNTFGCLLSNLEVLLKKILRKAVNHHPNKAATNPSTNQERACFPEATNSKFHTRFQREENKGCIDHASLKTDITEQELKFT